MGWFTSNTEKVAMTGTLTADERIALGRLEQAVEAGVQATLTMLEAGRALAEIRDRQLFRDSSKNWETYVTSRFRMTKRRADQMVAFAGIDAVVREMGTAVPEISERAARPLVGLSADTIREVVTEAAATPAGVTPATIKAAASKRRKGKVPRISKPRRFKVAGAIVTVTFNRKGNGSAIDALTAALRQAETDLERQAGAA
jgi:hypothetical protein